MKFNKVQKLYSGVIPSYFAALFTPLVLVPLVGDIVVNSIFILIVMLILQRKVPVKLYFKTVLVSYGIALGGFILAIMCSMGGEMQHGFIDIKPDGVSPKFCVNSKSRCKIEQKILFRGLSPLSTL